MMQDKFVALVGLVLSLSLIAAPGAAAGPIPADPTVAGPTAAKVDTYLARLSGFGFSGAVIIEQDGRLILSKGYGWADREAKRRVTPQTVFTIGSITKQFTGAAVMKLAQEDKLDVNDPITRHFDDVPPDKAGITLHHLLTHTAGFPGAIGDDFDTEATRPRFIEQAMAADLLFAPGARYEYSNVGYSLLGMIVEEVSGKPYERFLRDELFTPAGMTRTGYLLPEFRDQELAVGYRGGERWGNLLRKPMLDDGPSWHLRANGGIHATTLDMYRWHRALQGEKILSAESKEKLFAPHVPEGPAGGSFYGYGWVTFTTSRGTKLIAHNGGNGIFSADFRHYVDENVMFFVAINVAEFEIDTLSNRIASVIFGHDYTLPPEVASVDEAALQPVAGRYTLPGGAGLEVQVGDGALHLVPVGQEAFNAVAPGEPLSDSAITAANDRTRTTIGNSARGDHAHLIRALSGGLTPEQVRDMAERRWTELRERLGEYRGLDVLGSTRFRERLVATAVRLNFEKGPHYAEYVWMGGSLRNARPLGGPPAYIFKPVSPTRFVAYDFAGDSIRRIDLDAMADAARPRLRIDTGKKAVTAVREK